MKYYEYDMSVPIMGTLNAHIVSETPLTKEEVAAQAFENADFGELENCDTNITDIDTLYFEETENEEDKDL